MDGRQIVSVGGTPGDMYGGGRCLEQTCRTVFVALFMDRAGLCRTTRHLER
jgi:hypothetical protein